MFANSNLSSNAAVFTPQGATNEYMQQQYYTSEMNSYGMASYNYGYDTSYSQSCSWNQNWSGSYTKKSDVLNLDDFSDLSDSGSEDESPVLTKTITVKKEVLAPEALEMEWPNEPAEEPSPCATDAKSLGSLEDLEVSTADLGTESRTMSTGEMSSASSEPEGEMLENLVVYDIGFLLKCRVATEAPCNWYRTMEVEQEKIEKPKAAAPETKPAAKEIRRKPKAAKLESSENSWGAQQRRLKNESVDSKEQVSRTIKSILNKLTLEKFASLSQQLLDCGISSSDHLVVLIHEVFEKATTQHHFIDMYADLCVLLHEHFMVKPLDEKKLTFKRLLLDECQSSFERLLAPPTDLDALPADERTVAEVSYKTHMLGNIKLVGGLLARGMLAAKVGIAILEELLSNPTAEALESVCALLTALGPTADRPEWPQTKALSLIFDQLAVIVKSKSCQTRERCLLKDLLDLRRNGWVDKRPKKLERAMTLAQVAEGPGRPETPKMVRKVVTFDQEKFRTALRSLLRSLPDDLPDALEPLRAAGMPPAAKQPMELAEFLSQVVQEGASTREAGFKAFLKVAGEWHSEALAQGVKIFVTDLAADVALDVPNLSQILEEFYNILVAARISPAAQQAVKGFQAN